MNNVQNSIGWAEWTWNPITGCKRNCKFRCYARDGHNKRRKAYQEGKLQNIPQYKHPFSRIQFHNMMYQVLEVIKRNPQHTFLFLSKTTGHYEKYDFPDNCMIGVTVHNKEQAYENGYFDFDKNTRKFISCEPLLENIVNYLRLENIDWVIIGGLSPRPVHKNSWIMNIRMKCKRGDIPVYVKDNARYPDQVKEFEGSIV